MASRKLEDLVPELANKAQVWIYKCEEAGLKVLITCTARTLREQIALYAQGRQSIDEVNHLRDVAGLNPILPQDNHKKVTWTMASKHIIDLDDNKVENDKATAFDFAIVKDGKVTWDIKADIDADHIPDYEEAGRIGESLGLVWGGRWHTPDYPHLQLA